MVFTSGTTITVTAGGIVGSELAPSAALATLPVSLMVIGTALMAIPVSRIMQRIGRRLGFACGSALGISAALLGVGALSAGSFVLFCCAALGIGATMAFSQQFRFAAAESVPLERAGMAVSFILVGSIGGAFVGPELVARSPTMTEAGGFRGALLGLAALHGVGLLLLLSLGKSEATASAAVDESDARSLRELLAQPLFVLAVAAGIVGQGVMAFIMTATPVSMHVVDGHALAETAGVVRAHVIGMYAPSLFTGVLVGWLGARRLMAAGAVIMFVTVAIGLQGHAVFHYWWALVLLGIGWNFLFVGGTTQLVASYRPNERFRAQGFNDFAVFGASALASLLAGTLLTAVGWESLLLSTLPILVAMLALVLWSLRARGTPAPA